MNQLQSVYKRFSSMLEEHRNYIDNVFIVINSEGLNDRNHFLNVSS